MDEQLDSNSYYTEDFEERIKDLTDEKMFNLLYQLEATEYWPAIIRYSRLRSSLCQSTIVSSDPLEKPTLISRNQGIMLGLADLPNAVITTYFNKKEAGKGTDVK